MKYKVEVFQTRHAFVDVEAENDEAARIAVTRILRAENGPIQAELVTDPGVFNMTMLPLEEPKSQEEDGTRIVTEWCQHCGEIEMRWNPKQQGYQAACPICGSQLILCDECKHTSDGRPCNYNSKTGTCYRLQKETEQAETCPVKMEQSECYVTLEGHTIQLTPKDFDIIMFRAAGPTGGFCGVSWCSKAEAPGYNGPLFKVIGDGGSLRFKTSDGEEHWLDEVKLLYGIQLWLEDKFRHTTKDTEPWLQSMLEDLTKFTKFNGDFLTRKSANEIVQFAIFHRIKYPC